MPKRTARSKSTKVGRRSKFMRRLKDDYGVTNGDLQRLLDTTPRTVARYLSGDAKPVGAARAVLKALELAEESLGGKDFKSLLRAGSRYGAGAVIAAALVESGQKVLERVATMAVAIARDMLEDEDG